MRPVRSAVAAVGVLLIVLAAGSAQAGVPEGPRIAFTKDPTESADGNALLSAAADGGDVRPLGSRRSAARAELVPEFPLAWSSDGASLAVTGFRAGDVRLFIASVSGGGYRLVPGSRGGLFPVFSPDGRTLAFTISRSNSTDEMATRSAGDFEGSAIRVVDLVTGLRRQLTPSRNGLTYVASSFSPDGGTLATTRVDDRRSEEPEAIALDLASGHTRTILRRGALPVYSPDGSRIAVLRQQKRTLGRRGSAREVQTSLDLFAANADGSGLHRLTRTPALDELWPSWDPSGERLAYTVIPDEAEERPSWIAQINADGTCGAILRRDPDSNLAEAAWRPGPGREAGRIAC